MTTKKSKSSRKTVRGHTKSTSGKINVPLDVRSEKDLPAFIKLLQKNPLTIILIYATWCPHCHTMMPHFDTAAKSPKNTVSAVKINETMLNSVNNYVKSNVNKSAEPISVQGYPSIILVNKKAEKVTDIEPVRNTNTMKKVMEQSGNLAVEAGLNQTNHLETNKVNRNLSPNNVVKNVVENEIKNVSQDLKTNNLQKNINSILQSNSLNSLSINELSNSGKNSSNNKRSLKNSIAPSHESLSFNNTNKSIQLNKKNTEEAELIESLDAPISPISPPNTSEDLEIISNKLTPAQKVGGGRGGSLLEALTRTTYTIAPAAALVATASYVMKNNHHRTHKTKKHKLRKLHKKRTTRK